jgi:hypothetical protein
MLRATVCWVLIAAIPASLSAADAGAMLYGKGVLRNGVEIPNSSAVFSGDLLETRADSIANLDSLGSSVIISPTSLVEFQGAESFGRARQCECGHVARDQRSRALHDDHPCNK